MPKNFAVSFRATGSAICEESEEIDCPERD